MRLRSLLVIATCLLVASTAYGQRNKLKEGRAAPGLDVERWINGKEISIQKGQCYLIAFFQIVDRGRCSRNADHMGSFFSINREPPTLANSRSSFWAKSHKSA